MNKKIVLITIMLMTGILLASCAPDASSQNTMVDQKPPETTMEEKAPVTGADAMMENSATPEMMGDKTTGTDAMMEKTGTPEMADVTPMHTTMDEKEDSMMGTETPQAGMMEDKENGMAPAWFATQLMDEVSGETFQIADFKGKVVLVETFAQWCPTCLRQQKEIERLQEMLGMPDDVVIVSLDVDPNEDAAMLKMYLEKHAFDWRFAIAPNETAREIGSLYGQQFLNPPSAPVLMIDRDGQVHPLPFGVKSAEDLQEALKPFLSDGM